MPSHSASLRPIRVFISYAHEDKKWLTQIVDHLGGLQHMGSIDAFSDTQIYAGQEWDPLIKRKLADAEVIILIISAKFLSSRYCMSVELAQAIERHGLGAATVIPVIANHCDWTALPIGGLQALPKDEAENLKPLSDWRQRKDAALAQIARQVREIVTSLQRRPDADQPPTTSVQVSQPSGLRDNLMMLQRRLRSASAKDLVSDILSGHWGEPELEGLARDPDLAKPALLDLASPGAHGSDTWTRMLFADLCARMEDPTDTILDIAFDGRVSWGDRTGVLPSLRFARQPARQRAKLRLYRYAEDDDMDHKRLAVEGFGFLGELSAIHWRRDQEGVGRDKYATQKLGYYIALASLDSFVHFPDKMRGLSPLDTMNEMLDAMEQQGEPEIHPFTFMSRLQLLPPGLAPDLLHHAVQGKHVSLLQGVLYALDGRGTPYLADDLYKIARDLGTTPELKRNALKALSSIPGEEPLQLLEQAVKEGVPGARSMFLLSVGTNRSRAHADLVLREIDNDLNEDCTVDPAHHKLFALWAAGELGREDPASFTKPLQKATRLPRAPQARAYAWLGLAKAGHPIATKELQAAAGYATDFVERLIIGISGLFCGHPGLIEGAIHASQANNAPIWRLQGHLYHDFQSGLDTGLSAPGRLLLQLLARGDLD